MINIKKNLLDELSENSVLFSPLIKDNYIHVQIMNETLSLSGEKLNMLEDESINEKFFKNSSSFYVYSFVELINSCYFQINAFLLKFLSLIKDSEDKFKIVLNNDLRNKISNLSGTYTSKSQINYGNKIKNLIEIFNQVLIDNNCEDYVFNEDLINKLRIIEILIRNNMSHGYDVIVQDLLVYKRRNGNKILFYEDSIFLYENIENENLNIIKNQVSTEIEDKKKSTNITKNYVDFFQNISNKNVNHIFEGDGFFILSEDLARVYLKRKHVLSVYSHVKIERKDVKIEMSKLPEKKDFPLFFQSFHCDFLIDIKFIDEIINIFQEKRIVFHMLGIYEDNYKSIFDDFIKSENLKNLKSFNKELSLKDFKNILDLPYYFLCLINNNPKDYYLNNIYLRELIELYIEKIELKDLNNIKIHETFLLIILEVFYSRLEGLDCIRYKYYEKALFLYGIKSNNNEEIKKYLNVLIFKKKSY